MGAAVDKVFATAELLEKILVDVNDMQTLLLSQRVNKKFKSVIDGSIHLRRILWFDPMPKEELDSPPKQTLVRKVLIPMFPHQLGVEGMPKDATDSQKQKFMRNPLICKYQKRLGINVMSYGTCTWNARIPFGYQKKTVVLINLATTVLGNHSWRRMLACQVANPVQHWLVCDNDTAFFALSGLDFMSDLSVDDKTDPDETFSFGRCSEVGVQEGHMPTMGKVMDTAVAVSDAKNIRSHFRARMSKPRA